jgi:hypothetical protein
MPKSAGQLLTPGGAAGSASSSATIARIFLAVVTTSGRCLGCSSSSEPFTEIRKRREPGGIVSETGRGVSHTTCASARSPVDPSCNCTTCTTSHRIAETSAIGGHANASASLSGTLGPVSPLLVRVRVAPAGRCSRMYASTCAGALGTIHQAWSSTTFGVAGS